MINPAILGKRVQRLRLAGGLNQAEFAKAARIGTGTVSMIENGRQSVEADTLVTVAQALGCSPEYLSRPATELISTRPWLRAYADASKRAVDRYVSDTVIAMEVIEDLRVKTVPETIPVFDGDPNDEDAIEEFAAAVREAANLEAGDVVGNAIRAAERLGCVVLPMDDELGRHMGLSLRVNGTPAIRVSRSSLDEDRRVPGDRQRFTVLHELGHLALHSQCPPPSNAGEATRIEKQAHRFAAAFLAPAEPLLEDLDSLGGRVTLTTLSQLKGRWGVAIKMLVVRMQQLQVIDSEHARSLYKQISARKWNKVEPVPVGNEEAIWLDRALKQRYRAADPLAMAAADSGLDKQFFERWTDWQPAPAGSLAAVVPMSPRRRDAGVTGSSGEIHQFSRR